MSEPSRGSERVRPTGAPRAIYTNWGLGRNRPQTKKETQKKETQRKLGSPRLNQFSRVTYAEYPRQDIDSSPGRTRSRSMAASRYFTPFFAAFAAFFAAFAAFLVAALSTPP